MSEPQCFCCLPWCGASYSPQPSHSREFLVDGRKSRFSYPALIDMHDVVPRSLGGDPLDLDNNVPLCHSCHMAHHAGGAKRLTFDGNMVYRSDGKSGRLVLGDRDFLDEL